VTVKHDFAGRYLLPDPQTGEERTWTRATTFAKTLDTTFGLELWGKRLVAKGIALNDDLRAVAAATPLESKKKLDGIAKQALDRMKAKAGANVGNALHDWTAQTDRGEPVIVPRPWDADINCYEWTLKNHGITTHPGLVERIVCLPDLGVAGTFDRVVEWSGDMWIADVKTAADLTYSWGAISIQLALYARAPYAWDEKREEWGPNEPVNWVEGIVIHLPAGQARCDLYWLNLDRGWEAAQLCMQVRDWRKAENLAAPFGVKMLGRSPLQAVPNLPEAASPDKNSSGGDGGEAPDRSAPLSAPVGGSDPSPPTEPLFIEGDPAYD
jgi:hypothetical protein